MLRRDAQRGEVNGKEPEGRLDVHFPPLGAPPRPDRNNPSMKHYSQELKESLVARRLAPPNESVAALARETRIPKDTLYGWRAAALGRVRPLPAAEPASSAALSSEEKFTVVLETATLNAHELGEYCRRKGLYTEQVQAWRTRCAAANATGPSRAEQEQVREQAREIRQRRGEVQRKDKALAEAAARLLLQKKVQALLDGDAVASSNLRSVGR